MLAIIEALKDWRNFLEGLPHSFEILTDHHNLEHWRTAQDLSRRQAHWSLWLSRFNFTLCHQPGKTNTQADALSRMPHMEVDSFATHTTHKHTFKHRLRPIKIRRIREVLPIQIQALPKLKQRPELLDQRAASELRTSCLFERVREERDGRQVLLERDFQRRERR